METRIITPEYAVTGQITPEDVKAIAEAGYKVLIDNRPDAEIVDGNTSDAIALAAREAGLTFVYNPVTSGALTMDNVSLQRKVIEEAEGPVFAYCRSGNRSAILWSLAEAGKRPTAEIVEKVAAAGYDVSHLAPQIEALAKAA